MGGYMTIKNMPRTQPLLVNAIDRLGRPIDLCVLSVAQEMAPQALTYAEKFVGDSCVAMNLLEEAATRSAPRTGKTRASATGTARRSQCIQTAR